jgi:hypothetical protein
MNFFYAVNAGTYTPVSGIVTAGLIFNVDASETASYPGSGSIVYDTAGTNNGTLTNGASWSTSGGRHFEFDGLDDYIELGSITAANPISLAGSNSHTIEVWFRGDASGDLYQRIIDKSSGGNAANGWCIIANDSPASKTTWSYAINGTAAFSSPNIWSAGTWYQMILTHSGTSVKVYRNTTNVSNYSISKTPPSVTTNMRIATWNHSTGREYNGQIGAIRIYNRVLTTAEISQNFDAKRGEYGI